MAAEYNSPMKSKSRRQLITAWFSVLAVAASVVPLATAVAIYPQALRRFGLASGLIHSLEYAWLPALRLTLVMIVATAVITLPVQFLTR